MQKLSKRLQAVADFVTPGGCVADIGTDHAYLPIYLVQSGRCKKAIAMDIKKGPLARAQEHIAANHLEHLITTRLSDGLSALLPGEADRAVIAGMGGQTVIHILEAAVGLLPGLEELVLEPQSDIAGVRKYLREHRMYIDREDLVLDDGKYYPILHVVMQRPQAASDGQALRMQESLQGRLPQGICLQRLLDQYGECTVYGRHPRLPGLLERDARMARTALDAMAGSAKSGRHIQRMQELSQKLAMIRALREEVQCYEGCRTDQDP